MDAADRPAAPAPVPGGEHSELARLLEVVARFRGEGGCAWYEAQSHESLVPYLIEETAELVEALEAGAPADIREELGDVLFQVLFHADVATQHPDPALRFGLEDLAREQREKLERRNPHVFGPEPTRDIPRILELWHEAKAIEKAHRTSVLDGIPDPLDGVARAAKSLGRAAQLGLRAADAASAPAAAHEDAERGANVEAGRDAGSALDAEAPRDLEARLDAEERLGRELLELVERGRADGLDPDRALRMATRRLEASVRAAEAADASARGRRADDERSR